MKISDVIGKILDYHPKFPDDYAGCDGYKSGDPDAECTGVVCALVPTVEVIRKTKELGCSLLYVHEPTFYCSPDYPDWRAGFENRVYEEKKALLDEAGIAIWRDHDHAHAHNPDSIFTGVIKYLGWEEHQTGEELIPNTFASRFFEFEDMTVGKMNEMLKERLSLNGIRYIGRPEDTIRKVALVGHLFPMSGSEPVTVNGYCPEYSTGIIKDMEEKGVDAIIPGEVIDWTVMSYIRDAVQLGKVKAAFNVGHFNLEELGMKYAADWISDLIGNEIPVHYVPSGDIYRFA